MDMFGSVTVATATGTIIRWSLQASYRVPP
jgi:hypothetical protein